MDFLAIVSLGAYPTPTPTATARAAYAVSFGLLGTLSESASALYRGITGLGMNMIMTPEE